MQFQRRKASASVNNGNCVEVTFSPDNCSQCHNEPPFPGPVLAVHDSKDVTGVHQHYTVGEWNAFLDGVAKGEFTIEALSA